MYLIVLAAAFIFAAAVHENIQEQDVLAITAFSAAAVAVPAAAAAKHQQ